MSNLPKMQRSRTQLATAYAPGALFTFEGGRGGCRSVAVDNKDAGLTVSTQDQIFEQIKEYIEFWDKRGQGGKDTNLKHDTEIEQRVDRGVLNGKELHVTFDKFAFTDATLMGYVPFPLSFVCRKCGAFRQAKDVADLAGQADRFDNACGCGKGADWEQLDVVMVHWSGRVEPLSPVKRRWDKDRGIYTLDSCRSCGGKAFKLKRDSASFSDWTFICANPQCNMPRDLQQKDEATLRILANHLMTNDVEMVEFNMEPISLRASAAFYPHGDRLIVFSNDDKLGLLQRNREDDLLLFLAKEFDYPGRSLNDQEKQEILKSVGREAEWAHVSSNRALLAAIENMPNIPAEQIDNLRASIKATENSWKDLFHGADREAPGLENRVAERSEFVRRYDPIRMAVEHNAFSEEKLFGRRFEGGKAVSVCVDDPDPHLIPSMSEAERQATVAKIQRAMRVLGMADMRLVRNLELCEYTFGFTRAGSLPLIEREKSGNKVKMPVRLNLFDPVGDPAKHPVYCIKQANEGFYVRLDEQAVLSWLEVNGMGVDLGAPPVRLGGKLIEEFPDATFTRFLDDYRKENNVTRSAYPYVYTLLHTMSHQLIGLLSELSGLDLGSFGEHLFVPDLAFLVYRRGTTMDLGNLSSSWRNYTDPSYGNLVLDKMMRWEGLRCGSETVCLMRGGACPDCLLLPETACLTRNELLSRSVLTGRGLPSWDENRTPLADGFYNVARRIAEAR